MLLIKGKHISTNNGRFLVCDLGVNLFRLGIAFILLALLFPLVDVVGQYVSTETAGVVLILWLIGSLLVLVSAFVTAEKHSGGGAVPSS